MGQYIARIRSRLKPARLLKIAVDAGNGMGGISTEALFSPFDAVELWRLSFHPDGYFSGRSPNPLAEGALDRLSETVRKRRLDFAFDGDAVLFSDEAERVYQAEGLEAFAKSEREAARRPLSGGPFKEFLAALHHIQSVSPADASPIRTALITARAAPAHERVIRTLRAWNVRIDEALFLGGMPKAEFLRSFRADIFFDDQRGHCDSASRHVATGHVPHGVANS